ncbi:hypothetical protein [Rhizobacter sp. Root404]|jgi:hypothetical protein|uniref:hypothetical protein n=1 Tax=Rhizobacter sp. Root404 TaxID=1736528 RepID=UPI0006F264E0|nr:hypothetical protein [Rhizobacter sp. Root404]KQW37613.1 hypothetical protein ASC76_05745 [Rhizobacter sp. Root404]
MIETTSATPGTTAANLVDKAADSATRAVDATKAATTAALDSVSDKVETVRGKLSPALNNASAPLDSLIEYTQQQPVRALLAAAGVGAVLMAIMRPARRVRY